MVTRTHLTADTQTVDTEVAVEVVSEHKVTIPMVVLAPMKLMVVQVLTTPVHLELPTVPLVGSLAVGEEVA